MIIGRCISNVDSATQRTTGASSRLRIRIGFAFVGVVNGHCVCNGVGNGFDVIADG